MDEFDQFLWTKHVFNFNSQYKDFKKLWCSNRRALNFAVFSSRALNFAVFSSMLLMIKNKVKFEFLNFAKCHWSYEEVNLASICNCHLWNIFQINDQTFLGISAETSANFSKTNHSRITVLLLHFDYWNGWILIGYMSRRL